MALSVMYYRRENRNLRGIRNEAVPEASYTPITIVNPLTNGPLTIYNQAANTVGGQRNVLVNSPLLDNDYDGFEISVQRRFSQQASLLAGYHYGKARGSILTSGRVHQPGPQRPEQLHRPHWCDRQRRTAPIQTLRQL